MQKLVTIAVPIYKRLEYLPHVLGIVAAQDYPNIDLLVSDNGMNGTRVREIVEAHYSRPYRFRQNPSTLTGSTHFNQLFENAKGEYVLALCDDDEISPNYVSELVQLLERYPQAALAIAKQEMINKAGVLVRESNSTLPTLISGADFIRGTWQNCEYRFECFVTILARTSEIKACRGYLEAPGGAGDDNAMLIKLCLGRHVAFSPKCAFRWRLDESSFGWSISIDVLADACRVYLHFLDTDPTILKYAAAHPAEWRDLKRCLVRNEWVTYLWRWRDIYRKRLSGPQWVKAAFAMPFIPAYYRKVARVLMGSAKQRLKRSVSRSAAPADKSTSFWG